MVSPPIKILNKKFNFGSETLMYQNETYGVVGGGLGWHELLKSQHVCADFSANRFCDFSKVFPKYHKLKNCHRRGLISVFQTGSYPHSRSVSHVCTRSLGVRWALTSR